MSSGSHFANRIQIAGNDGTSYGRSGVSFDEWNSTIIERARAIHDPGLYYGSIGSAWSKNAMLDSEADRIAFIETYRGRCCREDRGNGAADSIGNRRGLQVSA